jgi:hypothetical protein
MSHRTVVLSSFGEYLAGECDSKEARAEEERDRDERLARFPYPVMLQVSYPELDFTNRWCWQNFGPSDGACTQHQSEYRACDRPDPHSHSGKWMSHWLVKTDYDFGFNEWYFREKEDQERFLANVDQVNWGEKYPK